MNKLKRKLEEAEQKNRVLKHRVDIVDRQYRLLDLDYIAMREKNLN